MTEISSTSSSTTTSAKSEKDWSSITVLGSCWAIKKPTAIFQLQIGCSDPKIELQFKRPVLLEWTFPPVWYSQRNTEDELEGLARKIMDWESRIPRMAERGIKDLEDPQSYYQLTVMGRVLRGALVMPRVALAWCALCLRKRMPELLTLLQTIPTLIYHALEVCDAQAYARCKEQRLIAKDEAGTLHAWQRALLQDMTRMEKTQKKRHESSTVMEARWSSFTAFMSHLFDQMLSLKTTTACDSTLYSVDNTTGYYSYRPMYQMYALYECLEPLVNRMETARYDDKNKKM